MGQNYAFWHKKWNKNCICAITGSRLRPGRNSENIPYTINLSCGHRFWRKPLLKWFEINPSCPLCRIKI